MNVTTSTEISYSLRLTPTEARKLHALFNKIAHANTSTVLGEEHILCRDLAQCLKDEVFRSEGTVL